eukprot:COSAG01_NODE_20948_length_926_cov_1.336155_1_plen_95_part_00
MCVAGLQRVPFANASGSPEELEPAHDALAATIGTLASAHDPDAGRGVLVSLVLFTTRDQDADESPIAAGAAQDPDVLASVHTVLHDADVEELRI